MIELYKLLHELHVLLVEGAGAGGGEEEKLRVEKRLTGKLWIYKAGLANKRAFKYYVSMFGEGQSLRDHVSQKIFLVIIEGGGQNYGKHDDVILEHSLQI